MCLSSYMNNMFTCIHVAHICKFVYVCVHSAVTYMISEYTTTSCIYKQIDLTQSWLSQSDVLLDMVLVVLLWALNVLMLVQFGLPEAEHPYGNLQLGPLATLHTFAIVKS